VAAVGLELRLGDFYSEHVALVRKHGPLRALVEAASEAAAILRERIAVFEGGSHASHRPRRVLLLSTLLRAFAMGSWAPIDCASSPCLTPSVVLCTLTLQATWARFWWTTVG